MIFNKLMTLIKFLCLFSVLVLILSQNKFGYARQLKGKQPPGKSQGFKIQKPLQGNQDKPEGEDQKLQGIMSYEYESVKYEFYFWNVSWDKANITCAEKGSELYSPEKGELMNLFKAHMSWNKTNDKYWIKWSMCDNADSIEWIQNAASHNANGEISNERCDRCERCDLCKRCDRIIFDASLTCSPYPLNLMESTGTLPFICTSKANSTDTVDLANITKIQDEKTISEANTCISSKKYITSITCPFQKQGQNQSCFRYKNTIFEFHDHARSLKEAYIDCLRVPGYEVYKASTLRELLAVTEYLKEEKMFKNKPVNLWMQKPNCNFADDVDDNLCLNYFPIANTLQACNCCGLVYKEMEFLSWMADEPSDTKIPYVCAKRLDCAPVSKIDSTTSTPIEISTIETGTEENQKKETTEKGEDPELQGIRSYEYKSVKYEFHFWNVSWDKANITCAEKGSELYSPEKGELMHLFKALVSWDKTNDKYWIKWSMCDNAESIEWIKNAASHNANGQISNERCDRCKRCPRIIFDASLTCALYPLNLMESTGTLPFICTSKANSTGTVDLTNITKIQDEKTISEANTCISSENNITSITCPFHKQGHKRSCFRYKNTIFEFHNHPRSLKAAYLDCLRVPGYEVYKPSGLEELIAVTKYLQEDKMFKNKPVNLWMQKPNCNFADDLDYLCAYYLPIAASLEACECCASVYKETRLLLRYILPWMITVEPSDTKIPYVCAKRLDCPPVSEIDSTTSSPMEISTIETGTEENQNKETTEKGNVASVGSTFDGCVNSSCNLTDKSTTNHIVTETTGATKIYLRTNSEFLLSTVKKTTSIHTTTQTSRNSFTSTTLKHGTTESSLEPKILSSDYSVTENENLKSVVTSDSISSTPSTAGIPASTEDTKTSKLNNLSKSTSSFTSPVVIETTADAVSDHQITTAAVTFDDTSFASTANTDESNNDFETTISSIESLLASSTARSKWIEVVTEPKDDELTQTTNFEWESHLYTIHRIWRDWNEARKVCEKSCQQLFVPKSGEEIKLVAKKITKSDQGSVDLFWTGQAVCSMTLSPKLYDKDVILDCIHNNGSRKFDDLMIAGKCKRIAITVSKNAEFISLESTEKLPFVCTATKNVSNICLRFTNKDSSPHRRQSMLYVLSSEYLTPQTPYIRSSDVKNTLTYSYSNFNIKKNPPVLRFRPALPEKHPKFSEKATASPGTDSLIDRADWESTKKYCEARDQELFTPDSLKQMETYARRYGPDLGSDHWVWTSFIACNYSQKDIRQDQYEKFAQETLGSLSPNTNFKVLNGECGYLAVELRTNISFTVLHPSTKIKGLCFGRTSLSSPGGMTVSTPSSTTSNDRSTPKPRRNLKPRCNETYQHDIHWPSTELGKNAFGDCPEGFYGKGVWRCGMTGQFTGDPEIYCTPINCTKQWETENAPHDITYFGEYFSYCNKKKTGNKSGDEVDKMMEIVRQERKKMKKKPESSLKPDVDGYEDLVSMTFMMFDKIIQADAEVWDAMDKKKRKSLSMDIIKESEETAWLMGCTENDSLLKRKNLEMQVIPLSRTRDVIFDTDDNKEDYAKLPFNLKSETADLCEQPVNTAIAATYKNIQRFLQPGNENYEITSNILGISMGKFNSPYVFSDNETIEIHLNHPPRQKGVVPKCVFLDWNKINNYVTSEYGVWNPTGCDMIEAAESYTECRCNHLTNFAILMDFTGYEFSEFDNDCLSVLSLVCSTVSSIALVLTIIIYVTVRSLRSRRNTITCNLAACLLFMNILVQTGLTRVGQTQCFVISVMLQYCVLASFLWMLLEGALLYKMVILVFETTKIRLPVVYGIAYGIPLIIVIITSCLRPDLIIREKHCWLSYEKGMIWSVIGPIVLIIAVNIVIFGMTLNAAIRIDNMNKSNKSIQERKSNLITRLKGMISLTCVLGFTWVVGFLYIPQKQELKAYLFVILNGLQGVFLFVTQMILNNHVRNKLFVIYKESMAKFTSATSTWNSFLNPLKAQNMAKVVPDEEKTNEFTDIRPTPSHVFHIGIYPTAPPAYTEKSSCKMPLFEEESQKRHPFEINAEI